MWLYFIDKNIKEVRKNLKNVLYIRPYDIDSKRALFAVIKEEKGIYRRIQITEEMSKWNFPFETLNMFFEGPGHSFIKDFIILRQSNLAINKTNLEKFGYIKLNGYKIYNIGICALFKDGSATYVKRIKEKELEKGTRLEPTQDNYEIIEYYEANNNIYEISKLQESKETKTKKLTK